MFTRYQPQKRRLLYGAISLFALLTCLRIWVGPATFVEPARAQIPDSGMQRKLLLEEARQTNRLLAEIKQLLENGTFNVRMQGADNQAPAPTVPAGGRKTPRP